MSKKLRDGFYLELSSVGENQKIYIRRESKSELDEAYSRYKEQKNVKYLGEMKNGKWIEN